MYNLLVTAESGAWDRREYVLPLVRYLEHTEDAPKARFSTLSPKIIAELQTLPTVFAYETPVGSPARVGWLTSILTRDREVRVTFALDDVIAPIPQDRLVSLSWELQIGDYELNRTHWAIKDADLINVIQRGRDPVALPRPYGLLSSGGPSPAASQSMATVGRAKVFIVHGRDAASKNEVARFLEKLGLEPVILHERPNAGRTLITKFQEESADIAFAVVLMTPDDQGALAGGQMTPRARQNVIFELGFFIGRLGASRVCALVSGELEKPSDFDAVVYIQYSPQSGWKTELIRELRHAGLSVDANLAV